MNSFLPLRSSGFPHSQFGPKNPDYGHKKLGQRAGPLQPQHFNTIQIPKAMLTPPFLQYSALTPGQKQYLCTVCEAYSKDHMRKLMQQHYLNVLHRSIGTGFTKKSSFTINPAVGTSLPGLDHSPAHQDERSGGKIKGQEPRNTSPNLPNIKVTSKVCSQGLQNQTKERSHQQK
ncbi:protein FAM216A [Trichomycterus rosablanca]|uniref:protein FAM216A n=1 Tax=Trichomycterus rosablanca TaxID=2290929 RepID=UPI002F35653E